MTQTHCIVCMPADSQPERNGRASVLHGVPVFTPLQRKKDLRAASDS